MRNRLVASIAALIVFAAIPLILRAQTPAAPSTATAQSSNPSSKVPDLSGIWTADDKHGGVRRSISLSDPDGKKLGKEGDIPYQPSALAKTMSEKLPGPGVGRENTTDPSIKFCEPIGFPRVYMQPGSTRFAQTPDAVYIFYESGPVFRIVPLNAKHPDDPDPQWWGDSVGRYENGDTLVVDSVGFKDKTWLDPVGHPQTEQLHLIERYKRVNRNTLQLDLTIDDPGAYTKPFNSRINLTLSKVPFLMDQKICSTR